MMRKLLLISVVLLGIFTLTSNVTNILIGADEVPGPRTIISIYKA